MSFPREILRDHKWFLQQTNCEVRMRERERKRETERERERGGTYKNHSKDLTNQSKRVDLIWIAVQTNSL